MGGWIRCSLAWAMSGFLLFVFGGYCISAADERPLFGKVVSITSGKALARDGNSPQVSFRRLKPGDSVFEGDVLNTDSQAALKILMSDRTVLDIGPSTMLKVDEYKLKKVKDRDVQMSVGYGKIRALVSEKVSERGKFKVHTRAATMGVRGTEFIVEQDLASNRTPSASGAPEAASSRDSSRFTVVHGKVDVVQVASSGASRALASGPSVILTQGMQVDANAGVAPQVANLSTEALGGLRQEVKIEDNTFASAVDVSISGSDTIGAAAAFIDQAILAGGFVPQASELGMPGVFGDGFGLQSNFVPGVGDGVTLKVKFNK